MIDTNAVSEKELSITKGWNHELKMSCFLLATNPLKPAKIINPTKSKASAIVADDILPPLRNAYIDPGM